jgi:hypothetical protein
METDHDRTSADLHGPGSDRTRPDHNRSVTELATGSSSRRRVTVREAADALGISVEAVRARIKRGKLSKEKGKGGTVYVWLDANQSWLEDRITDQTARNKNRSVDRSRQNVNRTGPDTALVEALRDQIELLRAEIEDRKEESRRKDAIIMSLSQRIPELEAASSQEIPDTPEPASESTTGGDDIPQGSQEAVRQHSWLYRFFFGPQ